MNDQIELSYMASLYMALADPTRLRLLRLMAKQEVCVNDFTMALGDSQPKISRHLAYLRNAGIVDTRRNGKWIHYRIKWPEAAGGRATLEAALEWLAGSTAIRSTAIQGDAFTYANADISDHSNEYEDFDAAHNELEEFLL